MLPVGSTCPQCLAACFFQLDSKTSCSPLHHPAHPEEKRARAHPVVMVDMFAADSSQPQFPLHERDFGGNPFLLSEGHSDVNIITRKVKLRKASSLPAPQPLPPLPLRVAPHLPLTPRSPLHLMSGVKQSALYFVLQGGSVKEMFNLSLAPGTGRKKNNNKKSVSST